MCCRFGRCFICFLYSILLIAVYFGNVQENTPERESIMASTTSSIRITTVIQVSSQWLVVDGKKSVMNTSQITSTVASTGTGHVDVSSPRGMSAPWIVKTTWKTEIHVLNVLNVQIAHLSTQMKNWQKKSGQRLNILYFSITTTCWMPVLPAGGHSHPLYDLGCWHTSYLKRITHRWKLHLIENLIYRLSIYVPKANSQ